jgi:hypothetical protein
MYTIICKESASNNFLETVMLIHETGYQFRLLFSIIVNIMVPMDKLTVSE